MALPTYLSVCDRYTPTRERYTTVAAFLDMCLSCFGEAPKLRRTSAGTWTDESGQRVLEEDEDTVSTIAGVPASGQSYRIVYQRADRVAVSAERGEQHGGQGDHYTPCQLSEVPDGVLIYLGLTRV